MDTPAREEEVEVRIGGMLLQGELAIPAGARALAVFAHGGSARDDPGNRFIADQLRGRGIATLLVDLNSEDEASEAEPGSPVDVPALARRMLEVARWAAHGALTRSLPRAWCASNSGAAVVLSAEALEPGAFAIVCRGGRPGLARDLLPQVRAPVRFIVGDEDDEALEENREAASVMTCEREVVVVAGAGHLVEEPGALEEASELAAEWLLQHLPRPDLAGQPEAFRPSPRPT